MLRHIDMAEYFRVLFIITVVWYTYMKRITNLINRNSQNFPGLLWVCNKVTRVSDCVIHFFSRGQEVQEIYLIVYYEHKNEQGYDNY